MGVGEKGGGNAHTHLIISEGVTAIMASVIPAPKLADRTMSHMDRQMMGVH